MRKIRIGNDIAVQWSLVAKGTGEPFVVEGKDIRLSLKSIFATQEITDFTAQGNTIAWTFKGAEQKQTGIYSLVVSVVDAQGAMVTTDVCQFVELVACSCEANGADEAGVQTESIDLISSIEGASYDDTELREELTRLDGELTELSTRIDNIGEGGSSMFEAIKGETSYEEIKAAFEAKKVVYCHYDNRVYLLSTLAHNVAYFSVILGDYHYRLAVYPSNPNPRWGEDSRNFTHKLETLDNGNAKITIAGKSAEVATPQYVENAIQQSGGGGGTPSGDPMHYMFEAVGATYNATDADIPMVGMYGDSYVHKAHHWCLGEVGDLTNEEIREIYALTNPFRRRNVLECTFAYSTIRTNLPIWDSDNIGFGSFNKSRTLMNGLAYRARGLEVFNYVSPNIPITSNTNKYNGISEVSMFLYQAQKLKKILGVLDFTYVTSAIQENSFRDCSVLEELRIHSLKVSIVIKSSPMLSNASILYMIKNSAATSPIVITLHADAKARAEADAEIVAALSEKTNVTLGV